MKIDSPSITGSFTAQNGLTGSLFGTASWATNALTASLALTASQAISSSYAISASSLQPTSITSSGLNMSTSRILGRTTAGTGNIEQIQIGSGLSLTAGQLSLTGTSGVDTYSIICNMGGTTLAANTIYYIGQGGYVASTTANRRNVFIPFTGTLTNATITAGTTSTTVTAVDVAVAFRLNNTTDTSLGNIRFTGGNANSNGNVLAYNVTGLNTSVAAGDFCEIKITTPVSYAAPPTAASITVLLYFTRTA
jgi:hypothetical protein